MRTPLLLLGVLGALLLPAAAHAAPTTVAIFGDTPYGATQVANFPKDIDDLNADPDVDRVVHVGDIKSGSTDARLRGNLQWLKATFAAAKLTNASAVVLVMQADLWDTFAVAAAEISGYVPVVEAIAREARSFKRPVLLVQGDSHVYKEDKPLTTVHPAYPNAVTAPNVTRILVQGSTTLPREWLKLTLNGSGPAPLSWGRVPFTSQG